MLVMEQQWNLSSTWSWEGIWFHHPRIRISDSQSHSFLQYDGIIRRGNTSKPESRTWSKCTSRGKSKTPSSQQQISLSNFAIDMRKNHCRLFHKELSMRQCTRLKVLQWSSQCTLRLFHWSTSRRFVLCKVVLSHSWELSQRLTICLCMWYRIWDSHWD